jgi:SAM-dependent methyltransferase
LKERHDDFSAELRIFADSKVDRSGLDEVLRQISSALDLRPQRFEMMDLKNHLLASVHTRAAKEEILPLEQAIFALSQQSLENRALAESSRVRLQGALDAARSEAKALVDAALEVAKADLHVVATATRLDVGAKMHEERQNFNEAIQTAFESTRVEAEGKIRTELGAVRSAIDGIARRQDAMSTEEDHVLDDMYARFEDRFRGSRADIKQRAAIYLPLIHEAGAGTANAPVVDLGCGRGEWLELLRDEGLVGQGVDLNRIFLGSCREIDLNVTEADAVEFLRSLRPQSVGAVTSFHLIEHLSLKALVALIDESLRVLRPGGIIIVETPNPENLQVGSCNFYTDPTHRSPLPPLLTEALVELRGFVRPAIIRRDQERLQKLAPMHIAGDQALAANINPIVEVMLTNFFVSPDYAVVATKA